MSTVPCAFCGEYVGLDEDHVSIDATIMYIDDRNERDDFYAHVDCYLREADPSRSIEDTGDAQGWHRP
jgi:hypothetical protein